MSETALILCLLALLAVVLAYLYWMFERSIPRRWAKQVENHIWDLVDRRRVLHDPQSQSSLDRLADELFQRHLRSIPTDALARYPGIGAATVEKVSSAGGINLATLVGFPFDQLPGIGMAKSKELRSATESLLKDARSRFDSGACPEAQELKRRTESLSSDERSQMEARKREIAALETTLIQTLDLFAVARQVTFVSFLTRQKPEGFDAAIQAALPEVKFSSAPVIVPVPPPAPVSSGAAVAAEPTPAPYVLPPSPPVTPAPAPVSGPTVPPGTTKTLDPRLVKLRAFTRFGFLVARADGRVAQAERKSLRRFLDETFGHDPVLARHLDPLLEETEKESLDETATLEELQRTCSVTEQADLYALAERLADVSGDRNTREKELLDRIATLFGLSHSTTTDPKPSVSPSTPPDPVLVPILDPRVVLDIAPDIELSPELIRRKYTLLSDKLNPSKATALGPEFAAMAEKKRAELRTAAEQLMAPFGVPLDPPAPPPPPTDMRHNPDLDDAFGG